MPRFLQCSIVSATILLAASSLKPTTRMAAQQNPNPPTSLPLGVTPPATSFADAVCPVVYQVDDAPGAHGYHYIFYGNSFFINRDGYLLTAAHVVSEFGNGGHPSILLRLTAAPPRLVRVDIVATDIAHDLAILRATPNPFAGPYSVAALPLASEEPPIGAIVDITALRPGHTRNPYTFEIPVADSYSGTIIGYRSIALDTESPVSASGSRMLTHVFLFNHEVLRGQSGAPILSPATQEVLGLIEGRWLHPAAGTAAKTGLSPASSPSGSPPSVTQGAAVPIPYAIALLRKEHIAWSATQP
jgi:hypothetical protein